MFVALSPSSLRLVPPLWLRFSKTRPKLASAVVVSVQAKENNVAETRAVAAKAAPLMALG